MTMPTTPEPVPGPPHDPQAPGPDLGHWTCAVHEAGHAVAAAVCGWSPTLAVAISARCGRAYYSGATDPFIAAVVAACGPQAERLAAKYPTPGPAGADAPRGWAESVALGFADQWEAEAAAEVPPYPLDFVVVNRFIYAPGRGWAGREAAVRRKVERIIRDSESTIYRVATAIFQCHVLTEPRLKPLLKRNMLMLNELLNQVEDRKVDRERVYFQIVTKLANGETVSPAALESALKQAEKTPDDIRRDVALAERRTGWRATVLQAAADRREIADLEQAIAEADAELLEAGRKHDATVSPLLAKLNAIKERADRAAEAKRELEKTATGPALAELNGVRHRLEAARLRAADLRAIAAGDTRGPMGWSRQRRTEEQTGPAERRRAEDRRTASELLAVVQVEIEELKRAESDALEAVREA